MKTLKKDSVGRILRRMTSVMLIAALAALILAGCRGGAESTAADTPETSGTETEAQTAFLPGTTVNGVDIAGLTPEQAREAVRGSADGYTFRLVLAGSTYELTAEQLGLKVNTVFDTEAMLQEQRQDPSRTAFEVSRDVEADLSVLRERLLADYPEEQPAPAETRPAESRPAGEEGAVVRVKTKNIPAKNATIRFDSEKGAYVVVPEEKGVQVDVDRILALAEPAVKALAPELVVPEAEYVILPEVTQDSQKIRDALKKANDILGLSITITFTPEGGSTKSVTIPKDMLAKIYTLSSDASEVTVDEDEVSDYAAELSKKYSGSNASSSEKFRTTSGRTINISVPRAGASVDTNGLFEGMLKVVKAKRSATFAAPYVQRTGGGDTFWGGNYVEIDLDSQHLWLYKNGKCIVDQYIVSGNVSQGAETPTGHFTIYKKLRNRMMTGWDFDGTRYESQTQYACYFRGGCAIHDSSWRDNYGGTKYIYEGSHGCVGMPLEKAKKLYEEVYVGYNVVIYGGLRRGDLKNQNPQVQANTRYVELEVGDVYDPNCSTVSDGRQWCAFSDASPCVQLTGRKIGEVRAVKTGEVAMGYYVDATRNFSADYWDIHFVVKPKGSLHPATEPPTTEAPTTEAPTTEAPTTQAPTTEAPTTEAPTTEAPTTEAPTTEAPTTEAPTTEAPTTEAPTTEAPVTEAPTTQAAGGGEGGGGQP